MSSHRGKHLIRYSLPHRRNHRAKTNRNFESLEVRALLSANVVNYHNDQLSTGANLAETVLTPANVNATQFGKLATTPLDGRAYAQPLYMENVAISAGGTSSTHNVVFAATEHDSVYAIDSASGAVLWHTSFIDAAKGITTVPNTDVDCDDITPEIGITATPVIDPTTNTIYVVATTKEVRSDGNHYLWKLHALDLSTGLEKFGGPLTIGDTLFDGTNFTFVSGPAVTGTGDGAEGGTVTFNAARELERSALTLVDGNVYMAFGSYSDTPPAHGWVMAATMTAQGQSVWAAVNLTPNGSYGDVWAAGNSITADNGVLYVSTGNGTFDGTLDSDGFPVKADYGDSLVKLAYDAGATGPNANGFGLRVVDYFAPSNEQTLDTQNLDLGSGGILLLPDSAGSTAHPHLMLEGGKGGTIYLMDRDNMAGFNAQTDQTLQEINNLTGAAAGKAVYFNTPAYYNNTIYVAGSGDYLKALPISNAVIGTASSQSPDTFGARGGTPSISANGTTNGIVWLIDSTTNQLRAYNAANVSQELYTSDQASGGRDALGAASKFSVPTIADGRVFVGTGNSLVIYGELPAGGGGGGDTNVLNYHNDQLSTGANLTETVLTPANVNATQFGKLATTPLDGRAYAQPLYMENVPISAGGTSSTHNVVFAATEHDSVYAIDSASGAVLWHTSFIDATKGITAVPNTDVDCDDITPEIGITATPVIDPTTNTIYVVATTKEVRSDGNHYVWKLHALDLSTGLEKFAGPLTIGDTLFDGTNFTFVSGPAVTGTGDGAEGGTVTFNAARELERSALTLVAGNVYMAFGSYSDTPPAHGWVMAATMTAQGQSVWAAVNLTPNGSYGDVWAAGNSITADNGVLYVSTGNGTFDGTLDSNGFPVKADYGDSLVKLAYDAGATGPNANGFGLRVVDYFAPSNEQILDTQNLDLGSGGILLLPDSAGSTAHPHLMLQGGKGGTIYLMDRDNMAGFNAQTDQTLQEINNLTGAAAGKAVYFNTPAYYNNTIYVAGSGDYLKALPISNALIGTPSSQSPDTFGARGGTPSISANGPTNGIVWLIDSTTNQLRAYNAANVSQELYTSDQASGGRDALGAASKFSVPTIADGQVFVGTGNSLVIYGELPAGGTTPKVLLAHVLTLTKAAPPPSDPPADPPADPPTDPPADSKQTNDQNGAETPLERYIASAYQNVLGRPVDAQALAWWSNQLAEGTARLVFTDALTHSDEYYHLIIQASYQHYLVRAADTQGLNFWTGQMRNGLTDELLEADMIASDEYFRRAGGSDRGWIDTLYQDLLGRPADAQGEADWMTALAHGMTRLQAASGFTQSAEREAERVGQDYLRFLSRSATAAEVADWVQLFEGGAHNEDVVAGFLASDEYMNEHQ